MQSIQSDRIIIKIKRLTQIYRIIIDIMMTEKRGDTVYRSTYVLINLLNYK